MTITLTTCKHFGVRTNKREEKTKCQKCKEGNFELFKKCTVETNILMGTSIEVDEKGKSIFLPPGRVSDTVLMFEKFEEVHSGTAKKGSSSKPNVEPKPKKQTSCRVKGLSKLCRGLKSDGMSDGGIELEVAKMYIEVGMATGDAEAKAKSCVKNMRWVV